MKKVSILLLIFLQFTAILVGDCPRLNVPNTIELEMPEPPAPAAANGFLISNYPKDGDLVGTGTGTTNIGATVGVNSIPCLGYWYNGTIAVTNPAGATVDYPLNGGIYNSSSTFTSTANGALPGDWSGGISAAGSTYGVQNDISGTGSWRNKYLQLYHTAVAGYVLAYKTATALTVGWFECWMRFVSGSALTIYVLNQADNMMNWLALTNTNFQYYIGAAVQTYTFPAANTNWHHILFEFNCNTDLQWIWLDGVLLSANSAFNTASTTFKTARFQIDGSAASYGLVDAYADSRAGAYDVKGRNMFPMLSYNSIPISTPGEYSYSFHYTGATSAAYYQVWTDPVYFYSYSTSTSPISYMFASRLETRHSRGDIFTRFALEGTCTASANTLASIQAAYIQVYYNNYYSIFSGASINNPSQHISTVDPAVTMNVYAGIYNYFKFNFIPVLASYPDEDIFPWIGNNTADPRFYVCGASDAFISNMRVMGEYQTGWTQQIKITNNVDLFYHLEPMFEINSTHYNTQNTRLLVYQPTIENYDEGDAAGYSMGWQEQQYESVVLCNPFYKIKILDKESNATIFQDTAIKNFTYSRKVTIPSLKIENNAGEIINVSIYSGATKIFSKLCNPYGSALTNFTAGSYTYEIEDIYGNMLTNGSLALTENQIIYTPPNTRECFLSIANQRGDYLAWENYRIKVNNTQIYSNLFYREIGTDWNISIYTRFNRYITSTVHTVDRDANYLPFTVTQHSLKIFNQQEKFLHSNITFDPVFYVSSQYWSEWVAPDEICEYLLSEDKYCINITEYETGTSTVYSYNLAGDDILLITSSNTIANVLTNIANVNTTIGNQITNVEINITNQNTAINNSIINVDINLANINSTLGNMLLYQNTTLTAIANNITTFYIYQQNAFMVLQNNINFSFVQLNTSIYLCNNSIYTAVNALSAQLININNTVSGNLTLIITLNEYLTHLFQYCFWSDFLDWQNATHDVGYLENQIATVRMLNNYRNESLQVHFRYLNMTESLIVGAQETVDQMMPVTGVEYRVQSVNTGQYLTEWTGVPANQTIDLGYYNETIPATPEQIRLEIQDYLMVALFATVTLAAVSVLYIKAKQELETAPVDKRKKERIPGVRNDTDMYYSPHDGDRVSRAKRGRQNAVVIVSSIIVIVFLVTYFLIK